MLGWFCLYILCFPLFSVFFLILFFKKKKKFHLLLSPFATTCVPAKDRESLAWASRKRYLFLKNGCAGFTGRATFRNCGFQMLLVIAAFACVCLCALRFLCVWLDARSTWFCPGVASCRGVCHSGGCVDLCPGHERVFRRPASLGQGATPRLRTAGRR